MLAKLCWGLLALIHVLPALVVFKPSSLTSLYGVEAGSNSFVLLHHRAALFLGIFIVCIWALLETSARRLGVVVVAISMLSFLLLFLVNGMPESLRVIATADLIGTPVLLIAAWRAFHGDKV